MKVVITGSAGFLGSHLVQECLNLGWNVLGVDNFSGSDKKMADAGRFNNKNYSFVEGDILDSDLLLKLFSGRDVVFHLAAIPRVQQSTDFPIETNNANINGTLNVLEAAKKTGIKRVVYSASSSMYGGQNVSFPTPESTTPAPKSNYALQKYVGAEYCRLYSELYGLDTGSLVYFNLFGPHQLFGGAYSTCITAFFHAALNDYPCRIDGTGEQVRDLTYVSNAVQANILAAKYPGKINGQMFNIGCGEYYSVNQVFNEVQKLTNKKLVKQYAPPRQGDPIKSHALILKAKNKLGYEPKVRFFEGMEKTKNWWLKGCPV